MHGEGSEQEVQEFVTLLFAVDSWLLLLDDDSFFET